jgi:hypothetical protein
VQRARVKCEAGARVLGIADLCNRDVGCAKLPPLVATAGVAGHQPDSNRVPGDGTRPPQTLVGSRLRQELPSAVAAPRHTRDLPALRSRLVDGSLCVRPPMHDDSVESKILRTCAGTAVPLPKLQCVIHRDAWGGQRVVTQGTGGTGIGGARSPLLSNAARSVPCTASASCHTARVTRPVVTLQSGARRCIQVSASAHQP